MKKVVKLVIIVLLITSLVGCWDARDLEELLLVYGLGIDISQEDPEKYFITIGFPTIIEEAPEAKQAFSTEALSLGAGKGNLQQKVYREISYDNIRVVIFGEETARRGILAHVDSMLREPLFRGTTKLTVVKDRAVNLLEMEAPVSLLVSTFISDSIEQNYLATTVPLTTLRSFSHEYYTDGVEPAMPFICYGATQEELNIGCVALFQGDKMIHLLHGDDSKAFMLLRGDINKGIYTFAHDAKETNKEEEKEYVSINLKRGKSKIKTELVNGELHIFQDIFINSVLGEHTPKHSVILKDEVKDLEAHLAEEIKKDLNHVLYILQEELQNDNIGYGKYVKANHPEYFDRDNWNEQFSKAIIHVNPTVKIRTFGLTP